MRVIDGARGHGAHQPDIEGMQPAHGVQGRCAQTLQPLGVGSTTVQSLVGEHGGFNRLIVGQGGVSAEAKLVAGLQLCLLVIREVQGAHQLCGGVDPFFMEG